MQSCWKHGASKPAAQYRNGEKTCREPRSSGRRHDDERKIAEEGTLIIAGWLNRSPTIRFMSEANSRATIRQGYEAV